MDSSRICLPTAEATFREAINGCEAFLSEHLCKSYFQEFKKSRSEALAKGDLEIEQPLPHQSNHPELGHRPEHYEKLKKVFENYLSLLGYSVTVPSVSSERDEAVIASISWSPRAAYSLQPLPNRYTS